MPIGSIGESDVEESERATCRADVAFFMANELDALRNSESFIVDLSLLKSDASFLEIDRCVLHAGLRLMPGDDSSTAMQELVACLEGEPVEVDILHDNPPMLLDAGSSIWQEFSIPGGEDASCGVGYASDAGFLSRDLGMECILWGPGSIAVAHKPNEFLPLDEFAEAASVLRGVVDRVCALGEHP